jgi:hypothetical protein
MFQNDWFGLETQSGCANHELGTFKIRKEAIDWAKAKGHAPLVARARLLNGKKNPDH